MGVCIHEESRFNSGRTTSISQTKNLFEYAKEMNCNYVRLVNYPYKEDDAFMLDDEMGLLVWAKVHIW